MRFEFDIEKSPIDRRVTEIGFLTTATAKPPGGDDDRWLGFCYKSLEVFPAAGAGEDADVKVIRPSGQTPPIAVASNEEPEGSTRASRSSRSRS